MAAAGGARNAVTVVGLQLSALKLEAGACQTLVIVTRSWTSITKVSVTKRWWKRYLSRGLRHARHHGHR